ncbi:unnamed protein product, partial [Brassica oleracea]
MAAKFEIEKFNGSNFALWKLKMKAILRKDGCLAAISARPATYTDDDKWNEMDGNAMANLHLALADGVLSSIEEKKTAKEIWDHLAKLYEAKSLHNKIFLKRKLYTLRMGESTSVTEHINTLNTLFSQLTSLSYKVESQERAELLLQSLPDSYDQLIINLTNNVSTDSLVFDDVAAAVLEEESRRKRNIANTSDNGIALCCEAAISSENRRRFADIWLFDSGATYHMTSRREWFHHYESISGGSVYSCNDHELKIVGTGSIQLKMYDGTVCTIHEVRHVEGLKKNLLSVGQLDDLGCKVEVQNGTLKVIRGALVLMKGEKIAAKLYMLRGETLSESEAFVASSSSSEKATTVWHQKLGHM